MKIVKSIIFHILVGASAALAALMVFVSYSDHFHPLDHPVLACLGMVMPFFLVANLISLFVLLMVRWRWAFIPIVAFLVCIPAIRVYLPLHFPSEAPPGSIKIISFNVGGYAFNKPNPNPLDTIVKYLIRQNADIVCLQEDKSTKYNTTEPFDTLYPYNDTVHVNSPTNPLINAVGIHSRYPIVKKERISYESRTNGSVAFFLLIDGDTVIVVNNHLESTHMNDTDRQHYTDIINGDMNSDEARAETRHLIDKLGVAMIKRAPQAEAVHQYIEQHRSYPIIVCGDFNDTPISYSRRTVAQGLTDCFVETGNGPGISYNVRGFYFRIDYMMCSEHFEPYSCHVDTDIDASDHYPVVGWLQRVKM